MLLDRRQHVGQHRRAARARNDEQIGKSRDAQAQIGTRPLRPCVGEPRALFAANVDAGERTGHRIEADRVNDRVESVGFAAGDQAVACDLPERRFVQILDHNVVVSRNEISPIIPMREKWICMS